MEERVQRVEVQGEFRVCPDCGYRDGFHSMFRADGEVVRWLFICPDCHRIFDIGYTAPPFAPRAT
jgi:predicted RNA-binding Zn-ribbon protein involved in translation (DUF1610 family)